LRANYQLVRNLLAVSVPSDAMPSGAGHVVLVHDERNPAFQAGGKGYTAYEETRNALHEPERLKRRRPSRRHGGLSTEETGAV